MNTSNSAAETAALQVCIRVCPLTQCEDSLVISTDSHNVILSNPTTNELSSFTPDVLFNEHCPSEAAVQTLFDINSPGSAMNCFFNGLNATVVSYGEVDSGKTSCLFGKTNEGPSCFEYCASQLTSRVARYPGQYMIGVSFWELAYDPELRSEVATDLLRTAPGEFTNVSVNSESQASFLFDSARSQSQNFQYLRDGSFAVLNNRSHFFVRFTLRDRISGVVSKLHIIDLAGTPPSGLTQDLRMKLGNEEQLNCTRVGLSQFRGLVLDFSGTPVAGNKQSRLVQILRPLMTENAKTFLLITLRSDSPYSEAVKALNFAAKAQQISVPWTKNISAEASFTHFNEFQGENRFSQSAKVTSPEENNSREYNDLLYTLQGKNSIHENDIQTHDIQLENTQLRQKLRMFRENPSTATVLSTYESEISQLERRILSLRTQLTAQVPSAIKALSDQVSLNEQEAFKLRKQERKWKFSRKCMDSLSSKASCLQLIRDKQRAFSREHEVFSADLQKDIEDSKAEVVRLHRELESSLQENHKLAEEIHLMKAATVTPFRRAIAAKTGKTLITLLMRLRQGLLETYEDSEMLQITEALKYEVGSIYSAMDEEQSKEATLASLLCQLQEAPSLNRRNKALSLTHSLLT